MSSFIIFTLHHLKSRNQLGDKESDGRITLRQILEKLDVKGSINVLLLNSISEQHMHLQTEAIIYECFIPKMYLNSTSVLKNTA